MTESLDSLPLPRGLFKHLNSDMSLAQEVHVVCRTPMPNEKLKLFDNEHHWLLVDIGKGTFYNVVLIKGTTNRFRVNVHACMITCTYFSV